MEYFGLKLGQDLGNRVAHPYQEFRGVPPPPPPRAVQSYEENSHAVSWLVIAVRLTPFYSQTASEAERRVLKKLSGL